MKKSFVKYAASLLLAAGFIAQAPSYAAMQQGVWNNDLKSLFSRNQAIILAVNIRTFNANDKNKNDIIDFDEGETSGNFVNATARLDEIARQGINTIHLLPVTPTGKIKAMGTAGSLYAISNFTKINPQLDDKTNNLTPEQEAKNFINECHKRNIRVIIDLPSCGSYDLFLSRPELFVTDSSNKPVVPADWTDVRLFKSVNNDGSLNDALYTEYKNFVDFVQRLGADGIRADVATNKPFKFWQSLITYAKSKDSQFLFLAEASDNWTEPIAQNATFTPSYKLLEAGFDGWYGSYFDFKNWNTQQKFEKEFNLVKNIRKDFSIKNQPKAVIGSFATHDEVSPIITGGMPFANTIIWLQATLPLNSYFVDGFQTGDTYQYKYANQRATKSDTDDKDYYVHKGKIDIFNYSRKPAGEYQQLSEDFVMANKFKLLASEMINRGNYTFLQTNDPNVFSYTLTYKNSVMLVILNKDLVYSKRAEVAYKGTKPEDIITPLVFNAPPQIDKNKVSVDLMAGETVILLISKATKEVKEQQIKMTPVYK